MNYTLHVLKGRSQVAALRLIDGVNSIGRHDDCVIRIRSSQVSRRHCEVFEADGSLIVRDLGSSNGTYVNGDRIEAPRVLHPGDALTIGGVTLRVDSLEAGAAGPPDTAEIDVASEAAEVVEVDDIDIDLDFNIDDPTAEATDDLDVLELMGDAPAAEAQAEAEAEAKVKTKAKKGKKGKKDKVETKEAAGDDEGFQLAGETGGGGGDDAVAQFLMDLKLDDDDD